MRLLFHGPQWNLYTCIRLCNGCFPHIFVLYGFQSNRSYLVTIATLFHLHYRFVLTSVDMMKIRIGVTQYINKITIVINILLYLVFLAVVLIFQFDRGGSAITCGNKYISTPNTAVKQVTTVLYAVVIAFFSFLMCLALAIFGFKFVWQQYQRTKKIGNSPSNTAKKKVFTVAIVGGISFFLHSLYILIQTALYQPKIIFNFIAIFVTEIIPSLYMYYNQFTFNQTQRKEHLSVYIWFTKGSNVYVEQCKFKQQFKVFLRATNFYKHRNGSKLQ